MGIVFGTLAAVATPPTTSWAGFAAREVDTANVFSAGTLQLEGTTAATCFSTGAGSGGPISSNVADCAGSPLPSGQLTATAVANATSTFGNAGSGSPESAAVSLASCGAAEVADSSGGADTGLVYGAVTYGTAFVSPVQRTFVSSGISLSGTTGTYVGTTGSLLSPSTFTVVAWVRTTATSGGGIIGFSNEQPDRAGTAADRMLWVEPSGLVSFGVLSNRLAMQEVTSTTGVNDGNWHFVAATFSPSTMSVDVDGNVTSASAIVASTYTGFWHLGWAGDSTWPSPGTDEYLDGSEFGVGVFPALTAVNLTTLEDASSATAYAADAVALSPSELWLLSDSGSVAYTGAIPVLGATPLCKDVLIDVQATQGSTTTCVFPTGSGACPSTPPATATLSSFGTDPMPTAGPSLPVTVFVRMTLAVASGLGVVGLHLLPELTFTTSASVWTAELEYPVATLEM